MMSDWEREEFTRTAANLSAATLARNEPVRPALEPLFRQALEAHPDEEDRLLALWDRLVSRQVL